VWRGIKNRRQFFSASAIYFNWFSSLLHGNPYEKIKVNRRNNSDMHSHRRQIESKIYLSLKLYVYNNNIQKVKYGI